MLMTLNSLLTTYSQLLFNVFNCCLQSSGAFGGLVLHRLHRLQEGRYVGHHDLRQQKVFTAYRSNKDITDMTN